MAACQTSHEQRSVFCGRARSREALTNCAGAFRRILSATRNQSDWSSARFWRELGAGDVQGARGHGIVVAGRKAAVHAEIARSRVVIAESQ